VRRVRHFFVFLNVLVVICTLLAYSSSIIHPDRSSIIAVLGLLFPLLFLVNVTFAVSWLVLKKYYALISLAVLILGWKQITGLVNMSGIQAPADDNEILTIGTLNAHQLIDITASRKPTKQQMTGLGKALTQPDILCIQEGGLAYKFKTAMGYKYSRHIPGSYSSIFSNYPIIESKTLDLTPHTSLSGWFDIDNGRDTFRLFLLHLASNRVTAESERLMEEGDIRDTETWGEIGDLIARYARAASARSDQAELVMEYIAKSPYPVIVCGDFNDVPTSYTLAKIKGDLNDSFDRAGQGFGFTYAGKVPGLRIDYILADPKFKIISHKVPKLGVSDHNPVIVGIQITDL
jgi:endonuclease/exonuclease/phosphatase family metal-dependent hydrolase